MFTPPGDPSQQNDDDRRQIFSVAELTREIKLSLERGYYNIWVAGEISTLRQPSSGHSYFVLKDDKSQLPAVMFRGVRRFLRFRPAEGMAVIARGRLTVYEPRGAYQLQVEAMEPRGKGALQLAFEQLKERLEREGLFAVERKRALPKMLRRVGVVSSPSGAAFRDFCRVLHRRFENVEILLYPAQVQGAMAAPEIVKGIHVFNSLRGRPVELIVVTRGGGSFEDLWPFNEESLARAIYSSKLPVVSAVGHEIDTTIADFVADLRAPTPSAAAEMILPTKLELVQSVERRQRTMDQSIARRLTHAQHRLQSLSGHQAFLAAQHAIGTRSQRVDELDYRTGRSLDRIHARYHETLRRLSSRLAQQRPDRRLSLSKRRLGTLADRLHRYESRVLDRAHRRFVELASKLDALSPLAVLGRGYSLTWGPAGKLLRDANEVTKGDSVNIVLEHGQLGCKVERVERGPRRQNTEAESSA